MLHAPKFPWQFDIDARQMADRRVGSPLILAPAISRFDVELPVDRWIAGISQSPDPLARREVCWIDSACQPSTIVIGHDFRCLRIAMGLQAPARHTVRDVHPTRSKQIKIVAAIKLGGG